MPVTASITITLIRLLRLLDIPSMNLLNTQYIRFVSIPIRLPHNEIRDIFRYQGIPKRAFRILEMPTRNLHFSRTAHGV